MTVAALPQHTETTINTIAVDLTPLQRVDSQDPVLAFIIVLIQTLSRLKPGTNFILLIQDQHSEALSMLDAHNISRYIVDNLPVQTHLFRNMSSHRILRACHRLYRLAKKYSAPLARSTRRANKVRTQLQKQYHVDLLLCPLMASSYHMPTIPTLRILHDLRFRIYPQFLTFDTLNQQEQQFSEACQHAQALVTFSKHAKQAITHAITSEIHVIPVHMPPRIPPKDRQQYLASLNLKREHYIIYPTPYSAHKNHEMLLTAFQIASHHALPADIKLVCIGAAGERHQYLCQAVNTMNLNHRVFMLESSDESLVAALIAEAKALIYPSLYDDIATPMVSAMLNNVPVACSKHTALPEITGHTAILFDPRVPTDIADSLIRLVTPSSDQSVHIARGYERAIALSDPTSMAKTYWSHIENTVKHHVSFIEQDRA